MTEAELLFSQVLSCARPDLYLNKDKYLAKEDLNLISSVLARRIKGEPIQYILGKTEFMGLEIRVNQDVLIPRPETEILVEAVLRRIEKQKSPEILDLGAGSGCIAIALKKNLADSKVDASDISDKALAVARDNAKFNNVNINFLKCDLFPSFQLPAPSYDIIVSNPPYVAEGEINALQPELRFEPRFALSGGADGLDFYRRIIAGAPVCLKNKGLLIMEIGLGQRPGIEKIFLDSGKFELVEVIKDYSNIDRVVVAKKDDG